MLKLSSDLQRHKKELVAALRNRMFDQCESGLFVPSMGALLQASGVYTHRVRNARRGFVGEWVTDKNLIPTEGLTYLAGVLGATAKISTWYLALYAGAISPAAGWTAAGFTATASEITSGTEGFSESTRVEWEDSAAASGAINNNAAPATFTIVTASTLAVNGVGMLSASAKGATTGTLLSASRFAAQRTLNDTDELDVKYAISLTSS